MTWLQAMVGLPSDTRLLVGVEDEAEGVVVYVNARYLNLHTHVPEGPDAARLRVAWAGGSIGHRFVKVPTDALCNCTPDGAS